MVRLLILFDLGVKTPKKKKKKDLLFIHFENSFQPMMFFGL